MAHRNTSKIEDSAALLEIESGRKLREDLENHRFDGEPSRARTCDPLIKSPNPAFVTP
jgi:hypothetical protein